MNCEYTGLINRERSKRRVKNEIRRKTGCIEPDNFSQRYSFFSLFPTQNGLGNSINSCYSCGNVMSKNWCFLLLVGLSMFSCVEEPTAVLVHTGIVENISENGVLFTGTIQNADATIKEYGFAWAINDIPTVQHNVYVAGTGSHQGEFEKLIESDLLPDTSYHVRAFIRVENGVIYGEPVKFYSKGSAGPSIVSFSPAEGSAGTTIVIKGASFSQNASKNTVTIGPYTCTIVSVSAEELTVKLPANVTKSGKFKIIIKLADKSVTSTNDFTLVGPIPLSVSPASALEGTLITISGTGFSLTPSENEVKFEEVLATVLTSSATTLTLKVPHTFFAGNVTIKVTVNGITGSYSPFTIEGPDILTLNPGQGYSGRMMTINGKNFSDVLSDNKVLFANYWSAEILSATTTQLQVIIPFAISINPNTVMDISVLVTGKADTLKNAFSILSPWTYGKDFEGEPRTDAIGFTINNIGYIGRGSLGAYCFCPMKDFWAFNPVTNTYERKADFPGMLTGDPIGFSVNGKGYSGGGNFYSNGQFYNSDQLWEYNPGTNAWTQKNNLPAPATSIYSITLVINNKAYLLEGQSLYEYNDATDQWISRTNFPGEVPPYKQAISFAINNKGYVSQNGISFYEYNPSLDTWTQKEDYPGMNTSGKASFMINGYGYAGMGGGYYGDEFWKPYEFFRYDPLLNKWTQVPSAPASLQHSVALVLSGTIYFTTGEYSTNYLPNISLKFNPEY